MLASELVQTWLTMSRPERERAAVAMGTAAGSPRWPMVHVPCDRPNCSFLAATDYFVLGEPRDFLRMPLGGYNAQALVDAAGFLLPTRKMVDLVWKHADVKLQPEPLVPPNGRYDYAWGLYMQSAAAAAEHNARVSRALGAMSTCAPPARMGLVAGAKKDVCLSPRRPADRLAFYGWHRRNGNPIQGLNLKAHEAAYADYSHGIRFIAPTMVVDGTSMTVADVLADPQLSKLISDEGPFALAKARY